MKINKSKKTTALLTALVLVTSCFVGGTLARYITSTSSEDSARVAVWGINADDVEMQLFDSEYDVNGNKVAKSWNGDKIIAPGTSMSSQFSIVNLDDTLAPEVMYEIKINLDDTEIDQRILDNPSIQWKLDDNEFGTWEETKADILALSGDASGVKTYQALEIATEFANGKEHTIAWQWMLDDNNIQDTAMGNDAIDEDIMAKIVVNITARQVQEDTTGILNGTSLVFNLKDPKELVFRSEAPIDELVEIKVEDDVLEEDVDYIATSGSTVITLTLDYLCNLEVGNYTISIISENSTVDSSFSVIDQILGTQNTTPIIHNDVIPEGGIYYSNITQSNRPASAEHYLYTFSEENIVFENKHTEGENFPTLRTGDIYIYDGIEYRYNMGYSEYDIMSESSYNWTENTNLNGWSAKAISPYRTYFLNILTTINGADLISLQQAFASPSTEIVGTIPNTVKSMEGTFENTFHLTTAPTIPNSVTNLRSTFANSLSLTTAPTIPENVTNVWNTFKGVPLTGTVEINATNLENPKWIFGTTDPQNPLVLTGTSPHLEEISELYTNVTVQR